MILCSAKHSTSTYMSIVGDEMHEKEGVIFSPEPLVCSSTAVCAAAAAAAALRGNHHMWEVGRAPLRVVQGARAHTRARGVVGGVDNGHSAGEPPLDGENATALIFFCSSFFPGFFCLGRLTYGVCESAANAGYM